MAALTFYMTNALASGASHQNMSETSPGADVTATPGWTVAKTAATNYSAFQGNTKRAASTFGATALPAAASLGTSDAMRSDVTYNGAFPSGQWPFIPTFISTVTGGGTGVLQFRVYRSANADGSGATELTTGGFLTTATLTLSTSAFSNTVNWSAPAITLTDEYLFVQMAWKIIGAASSTSADVLYRVGGASTRFTTTNFTPSVAAPAGPDPNETLSIAGRSMLFLNRLILRPQEWGEIAAAPVVFSTPVGDVTAAGAVPTLLDTYAPAVAAGTAAGVVPSWPFASPVAAVTSAGQVPTLLDTHAPPIGAATAASPVPVLQSTHQPAVATVTAGAPIPTALITFDAIPVATVTVAAPVPQMVIVQEPYERPLARLSGIPRIPGSMAILRPQEQGQDASAQVLYAVPVAQVTVAADTTVLAMSLLPAVASATAAASVPAWPFAPAVANVTSSAPVPALQSTHQPAVAAATAAAPVPVLQSTHQPVVASATAAAPVPTALVTFDQILAATVTTASPVPQMIVVQEPYERPLARLSGIPRIPGSMAILKPQEWGDGPGAELLFAVPVANVTASSDVTILAMAILPAVASATSAGPAPALLITFLPAEGDATAAAPVVTMAFNVTITQDPNAIAPWGGLRRIPGSMALLKPQEWGDPPGSLLFAVPVASVTSAALAPIMAMTFAAVVASATAAGATPVLTMTMATPVGTVTSLAPVPVLTVSFLPAAGGVTAAGPVSVMALLYAAALATATAASPTPVYKVSVLPGVASVTTSGVTPVLTMVFSPAAGAVTAVGVAPALLIAGAGLMVFTSRTRTGGQTGAASAFGSRGGSGYSPDSGATDAIGDRGGTDG